MAHGPSAPHTGRPVSPIAFIDLAAQQERLGDRIERAIADVLADGRYVMGPAVDQLETELARRSGRAHALSCASGTDALVMALMALDVGPGDYVVVPDFTFVATAEVVRLVGATPVFADVDPVTYNLDPSSADSAWYGDIAPVGIIAVDLFGHPARHQQLQHVADAHGAWLILDAAQSFGATRAGVSTLAAGVISTTSFFPAKPLGAYGDGGALFTDDPELADVLRSIRLHGAGTEQYTHERVGLTGRLDTIQAAVLNTKLEIFDDEVAQRLTVAERYSDQLADLVKPPLVDGDTVPVWAQYTIEVDDRTAFRAAMADADVPTAVYYPHPLSSQGPYRDDPIVAGGTPHTARACERVVSLPMHPDLDPTTQDRIIDAVRAALEAT